MIGRRRSCLKSVILSHVTDLIACSLSNLWESCEDEDKCYSFEAEIDELVKEWLGENWAESVRKTGVYTDLHYCKHHWNYQTINLSAKEERVLF